MWGGFAPDAVWDKPLPLGESWEGVGFALPTSRAMVKAVAWIQLTLLLELLIF